MKHLILEKNSKCGSSLMLTLVLLSVSSAMIASIVSLTLNYSSNLRRSIARDQAFYLADAGLQHCMSRLVSNKYTNIDIITSRNFFSDQSGFGSSDWGFSSQILPLSGKTNRLVVTGHFKGIEQQVEMLCLDTSTSEERSKIFNQAIYSPGDLEFYAYDFIKGAVHGYNIDVYGADLPYSEEDLNKNQTLEPGETWKEAGVLKTFEGPISKEEFDAYYTEVAAYENNFFTNGKYDPGEAFVDSEGNGKYDPGEEFTDLDGDGMYDAGDTYLDRNGNGTYDEGYDTVVDSGNGKYDAGEQHVDDTRRRGRDNNQYDPAGGYHDRNGNWQTSYTTTQWSWRHWQYVTQTHSCADWPPEEYEDVGDGEYSAGEPFVEEGNGYYDEGELFLDDRNGKYDIGTTAVGSIAGMDHQAPGQLPADGSDDKIYPADLKSMYYSNNKTETAQGGALDGWGHDIAVTADDYIDEGYYKHSIVDANRPEHIFLRNPPIQGQGNRTENNVSIKDRQYTPVFAHDHNGNELTDSNGNPIRIDDYFLEDPTHGSFNNPWSSRNVDGTSNTSPMLIDVKDNGNEKVYFVDGNLYIHSDQGMAFMFNEPGTKITIVANGNITISDEFYYNADYDENQTRSGMNSTVVKNPTDALCLIALKNSEAPANSGNIYIGDGQFGTGGSIHSMLYAENNFIDKNLGGNGQPFISIFGNMAAGNEIAINRTKDTRLDVSLDTRVRNAEITMPGLPPPHVGDSITHTIKQWEKISGSWKLIPKSEHIKKDS